MNGIEVDFCQLKNKRFLKKTKEDLFWSRASLRNQSKKQMMSSRKKCKAFLKLGLSRTSQDFSFKK
jgi:hypothetical protein